MLEILIVKFESNRRAAEFLASELDVRVGDRCVVTTERGMELGLVLDGRKAEKESFPSSKIQRALRKATERDLYLYEKKKDREEHAHSFCLKRIKARKLPMKLSRVEKHFRRQLDHFLFHLPGTGPIFEILSKTWRGS